MAQALFNATIIGVIGYAVAVSAPQELRNFMGGFFFIATFLLTYASEQKA